MKVGNEIDHLGIAEIQADFTSQGRLRSKFRSVSLFIAQLIITLGSFAVIILLAAALQ